MNNGIFTWKDEKVELTITNGIVTKKTVVDEGSTEFKNFSDKKENLKCLSFTSR